MAKTEGVMFQFTEPFTLAFPNLFTPRKFRDARGVESGEPKYDLRAIIPPEHADVQALGEALRKAAANAGLSDPIEYCLHRGDAMADKAKQEGKDREFFRGQFVLTSRGQYAPGLTVLLNGRFKDFPMSGDERATAEPYFYGGVQCLGQFQFVGYRVGNNTPVVTAYPNIIVSLNRGERRPELSGGAMKSGAAAFAAHLGHMTGADPTAGMTGDGLPI